MASKVSISNINAKDGYGCSILHYAVLNGQVELASYLLEQGAHKNIRASVGETPLHFAVLQNDLKMIDCLWEHRHPVHRRQCALNLNAQMISLSTPLLLAAKLGHDLAVKKLLKMGADPDIKDRWGYNLKTFDDCHGIQRRENYPYSSRYATEFLSRKKIAHCFQLEGRGCIEGVFLKYTGGFFPLMSRLMYESLEGFPSGHLSRSDQKKLIQAFDLGAQVVQPDLLAEKIRQGSLIIVPTGWKGHGIAIIFYGSYMALCNLGESFSNAFQTVEIFCIQPKKVTSQIIDEIQQQQNEEISIAGSHLYLTLPKYLSKDGTVAHQDELCRAGVAISPKPIKTNVCTYGAAKGAMRAAIFLLKGSTANPLHYRSISKISLREAKSRATFIMLHTLQEYLTRHQAIKAFREQGDPLLAVNALKKVEQHIASERTHQQIFIERYREIVDIYQSLI